MKKRIPKLLKKPLSAFWGMEWTDIGDLVIDLIKDWANRILLSNDKSIPAWRIEMAKMIDIEKRKIFVCPIPIFDIGTGEINEVSIIVDGFDGNDSHEFDVDFNDLKEIYVLWKETYEGNKKAI